MSDTASIAASVINEAAESPSMADTPATSNAPDFPDFAMQEVDALSGDDSSLTRRTAAAVMATLDPRNFVSTRHFMVRRAYDPPSRNHQIARETIDLHEAARAEGRKPDPRDRAAMAAHDFAGGTNLKPGSEEWYTAADAVIQRIIAQGRAAK